MARRRPPDQRDTSGALEVLSGITSTLGRDELRVLTFIALRLQRGAEQYGTLDAAHDSRDWRRERDEEAADLLVYAACEVLRRSLV